MSLVNPLTVRSKNFLDSSEVSYNFRPKLVSLQKLFQKVHKSPTSLTLVHPLTVSSKISLTPHRLEIPDNLLNSDVILQDTRLLRHMTYEIQYKSSKCSRYTSVVTIGSYTQLATINALTAPIGFAGKRISQSERFWSVLH